MVSAEQKWNEVFLISNFRRVLTRT